MATIYLASEANLFKINGSSYPLNSCILDARPDGSTFGINSAYLPQFTGRDGDLNSVIIPPTDFGEFYNVNTDEAFISAEDLIAWWDTNAYNAAGGGVVIQIGAPVKDSEDGFFLYSRSGELNQTPIVITLANAEIISIAAERDYEFIFDPIEGKTPVGIIVQPNDDYTQNLGQIVVSLITEGSCNINFQTAPVDSDRTLTMTVVLLYV
jgi:hypothetical protein